MRWSSLCAATGGLAAVLLAGCAENVCDRSEAFDTSTKVGDCSVQVPAKVLGAKSACNSALGACSEAEVKTLEALVQCWQNLPVCSQADQQAWVDQSNGCYADVANLSEGCRNAFFGDTVPGQDGGGGEEDAGVDAGPQPDTDGGGALDIVATADEDTIAIAWVKAQPGTPDHWDVYRRNVADIQEPIVTVTPPENLMFQEQVDPATKKKYFVVGANAQGEVVSGEVEQPDAGMMDAGSGDGGMFCNTFWDCPPEQVCNLNSCQTLACTNSNVCPGGYLCDSVTDMRCERQIISNDGGMIDAGTQDAGTAQTPKPFISEQVEITASAPEFSEDREVSGFAATNIDLVAVDTARQFMIMEQENSIFGYYTENRGRSFKLVNIDTLGQKPRVAYEPTSRTMFACYNAAGAIRVRVSHDYGRTWRPGALDIANETPTDGGVAGLITDCDIAPWRDGTAMVVAIDSDDTLKMWTVNSNPAIVGDPVVVFTKTAAQFAPREAAIATLPSDFIVHVLFTITRTLPGGTDTEIVGMYRDQTTAGAFQGPKAVHNQNAFPQYSPTVAIDPVTKRGLAAFVSNESPPGGGGQTETIYTSMWMPSKAWATGSDLNIFVRNSLGTQHIVMPDRKVGEVWHARAPSIAATPDGKLVIAFAAGKSETSGIELRVYSVNFDYNRTNDVLGTAVAKGYYVPPAVQVSPTRVVRLPGSDFAGPIVVGDQQISTYYGFVQGVGTQGEVPNIPYLISRPR